MTENAFFTRLEKRETLRISGKDSRAFLQGLITNDIALLDTQPSLYACLLTPQGKFLYDFFITKQNETFVLDCEGGERAKALAKLLAMYKLRADVAIETQGEAEVYAVFGKIHGTPDPRHDDMGFRSFEKPEGLDEKPFEAWDRRRILLCVPDGSRDLLPGNSTMDEGRMDQLNAISYSKGCYLGQELTARMHYRGLGKKHLHIVYCHSDSSSPCYPEAKPKDLEILRYAQNDKLILESFPPFGAPIHDAQGHMIGEMRSSCGNIGLALVKD